LEVVPVVWIGHDEAEKLGAVLEQIAADCGERTITSRHARLAATRLAREISPEALAQVAFVLVEVIQATGVRAELRRAARDWALQLEGWLTPATGAQPR
jgi:hypothetical protein